tara:strand:+ start:676 stop:861 length:186 start_codon:yes stop_codon:yes gene_type:complete
MACKGTTKVEKHNLQEAKKNCKAKPGGVWDAQTCRCTASKKLKEKRREKHVEFAKQLLSNI